MVRRFWAMPILTLLPSEPLIGQTGAKSKENQTRRTRPLRLPFAQVFFYLSLGFRGEGFHGPVFFPISEERRFSVFPPSFSQTVFSVRTVVSVGLKHMEVTADLANYARQRGLWPGGFACVQ